MIMVARTHNIDITNMESNFNTSGEKRKRKACMRENK